MIPANVAGVSVKHQIRREPDLPAASAQSHGQVEILAGSRIEKADLSEGVAAKSAEGAGRADDHVQHVERAFSHPDGDDVLDGLIGRHDRAIEIADAQRAGRGSDARIGERLDQLFDGIAIIGAVRIEIDDDIAPGHREAEIAGGGFSASDLI